MAKSPTRLNKNQFLIFGLLIFLTYIPSLLWMWERWFARDSYYSHGILIPLVSAYLIWQQRDVLKSIPPKASAWGLRLFYVGIACHLLSAVFRVYFTSGFSLIIVALGLVLHFLGTAALRVLLFPVLFLVFMVPLPLVAVVNISFQLKMFAATIASFLLNSVRIANTQEGSLIVMSNAQVVVDDLCSGLRSLIALMALGSLFAYWLKGRFYKKVILFLSAIPIAVITNVVRIFMLSFVTEIWGSQYAAGFVHDASGFVVFIVAYLLLHMMVKILE